MKKIKKGDYGYRNHFKRKQLFIIALLALFIIAQWLGGLLQTMSLSKNSDGPWRSVTVLPAANLASPLIAIFKYHTPEQAFHEAYMPYEGKFEVLYDLVLTTPEDVIPSDVTVVHPTGIYVYCINPKLNVKRAEAGLNELLKANKLDPNLKIVTSRSTFDKRIHSLKPASEYEDDGTVEYGVRVIKGLSM